MADFSTPCLFTLLITAPSYSAVLDDLAARNTAIASIKSGQPQIRPDCPKTRRKEQFEEDLFGIRREKVADGKLNDTPFVYEVLEVGRYAIEGASLVVHTIDHPGKFGYVVVDKNTGQTYRLWADLDAPKAFNRLVSDLGVDVANEDTAIRVARLVRTMALGPSEWNLLYDGFQLKQMAEKSFHDAYLQSNWPGRFAEWWHRFESSKIVEFQEAA